ncbi:MAG: hypothetical protein AB1760_12665 [Pseudomonadota bacterium]|mgnify:CR=1 FL=1
MDKAFLFQLAGSMAAVGVLVALSALARLGRPGAGLDESRASLMFAEDFPDRRIDRLWITQDGKGALARSGDTALILVAVGDGYACRRIPWCQAVSALFRNGRLNINLGEVAAPRAVLAFDNWPPRDLAA